jgi:hypothetical protein
MLGSVRMLRRSEVGSDRIGTRSPSSSGMAMAQVRLTEDILDVLRIMSGKLQINVDAIDLASLRGSSDTRLLARRSSR